jgi:ubiquinol-cytochrome c reductase cytochrome b subunit
LNLAFSSVDIIMREVSYGWALRYTHANGAAFFLLFVYFHIARGLYFMSYIQPRGALWLSGVVIFLLMMATAFLGYVLPYGSMSLWGAVVITNLVSAIPYIGQDIVLWLWGGFSVGHPTLVRFFAIHYLLPFIISALVFIHLILLHDTGSSNPTGLHSSHDKIRFHVYFTLKDILGFLAMALAFSYFLFYQPDLMGHPDNFNEANPLVTPPSIVPEWYFLPFYAILRAIPNKLGGVVAMVSAILIWATLPFTTQATIRSSNWKFFTKKLFWCLIACFIFLGFLGQRPAEEPYVTLAQLSTIFYFSYFIILLHLAEKLDSL